MRAPIHDLLHVESQVAQDANWKSGKLLTI